MLQTKSGKQIDLTRCKEIAAGGEGKIFEHPSSKKKVVKLYHQLRPVSFADHLALLSRLGPEFVKPGEVLYINSKVAGFEMDYVNFNNYWLFNNLFNKGFCNANGVDEDFKTRVLLQLRTALESVHKQGIIIGDLNQYNLFVSKKGEILFVDVDSYATGKQPHSGVLLDEIRDWTTMNINEQTDAWAYDILVFWTTTFCHPFKWVAPGNTETLEQRVKAGKSFLSKVTGMKVPPLYAPPTGELLKQFQDVFGGRRYMVNLTGSHIPVPAQVKQAVASASVNIRQLYDKVTHVNCAGNYVSVRIVDSMGGVRWKLVETSINKITRELGDQGCDELYPTMTSLYAYRSGDTLISSSGFKQQFNNPEWYFKDGSLAVFDYADDIQWNFNLKNQMGSLDATSTPIFARSVILRDSAIQNFGGSKYLNLPFQNRYMLLQVPLGTKNAWAVGNYASVEYTDKRKTGYCIINAGQWFDMDYMPYFAVINGMLALPDNGCINVMKDGAILTTLDVPNCTRDSKLYSTASGILMLESNILYLLNTK